MSCFEAENSIRPDLQHMLEGVDPWAVSVFLDPERHRVIESFQTEFIEAPSLVIMNTEGEVYAYEHPRCTVYTEDGLMLHIRQNAEGKCGVVLSDMTTRQIRLYADVEAHFSETFSFDATSRKTSTEFLLRRGDPAPFIEDAAQPLGAYALTRATRCLAHQREKESLIIGSAGWVYKAPGTMARTPAHDWTNLVRQHELLEYRGVIVSEAPSLEQANIYSYGQL